jgi:hypothetical protein
MRAASKRRRGSRASAELVGVLLSARLPRVAFAIFAIFAAFTWHGTGFRITALE